MELRTAKGRLFLAILLSLTFPLLNQNFNIVKSAPLKGVGLAGKPVFSYEALWKGSYQTQVDQYINDVIGFRGDMIRSLNQLDLTLFNKLNTGGAILGRHNNLFHKEYIDAYCGNDYAGDNYPMDILVKMKKVQDTLERMGKSFVFIHAPSKASYYAEDIPEGFPCNSAGKTNLKNYIRIGDSLGIHQLDFDTWYVSLKGKTPHPLFDHQGIHWTLYGALFAVDSLISYIERSRNIHMLHPVWSETEHTGNARLQDDDLESIQNLIYPLDTAGYWYPKWHYVDKSGKGYTKPKVIYIGDSFIGIMTADGIMNSDTTAEYWHYFKDVWVEDTAYATLTYDMTSYPWLESANDMNNYNWRGSLQKADCIVLIYTQSRLLEYGGAFIDKAYEYFYPQKK